MHRRSDILKDYLVENTLTIIMRRAYFGTVLFVAVGRPCAKPLPTLGLGSLNRSDLPAGVQNKPLVGDGLFGKGIGKLEKT